MKKLYFAKLAAMAAVMLGISGLAEAAIQTTANPNLSTDIGARIRWGATGFEASVLDSNPLSQSPTLNPAGNPVWQLNTAYGFAVNFDPVTGALSLSVDFNGDQSFGAGESISRNSFAAPGATSYAGQGFNYLSISGNEGGSTGRSTITNLAINGASQSSLTPNGGFLEVFYEDTAGLLGPLSITGNITFSATGTAQERPSWNFNLKGPAVLAVIPEASTIAVWSVLSLIGAGVAYRKRAGK